MHMWRLYFVVISMVYVGHVDAFEAGHILKSQAVWSRFYCAVQAQKVINVLGLNACIKIPRKTIITDSQGKQHCMSQYIPFDRNDPLQGLQQPLDNKCFEGLSQFVQETGFTDWGTGDGYKEGVANMVRSLDDGAIYCIDTEAGSFFARSREHALIRMLDYFAECEIKLSLEKKKEMWKSLCQKYKPGVWGIATMCDCVGGIRISDDRIFYGMAIWLLERIEKQSSGKPFVCLPYRGKF